jgi:hypothetical protein
MWYYEEWTMLGVWSPRTEPTQPSAITASGTKRKIRAVREVPENMTGYDLNVLRDWSDAMIVKEAAEKAALCPPDLVDTPCSTPVDPDPDTADEDIIRMTSLEVAHEVERAMRKHAPMHSPHEGWSVIFEELEELREHVRADTGRSAAARKEALQIAAMGIRYALDLCGDAE